MPKDKKITLNNIWKVSQKLDFNKYHLHYEMDENFIIINWSLYRKYYGWLEDNSKPIMSSDVNTYKELCEFVKKHHIPSLEKIEGISFFVIILINLIVSIINIFLNNSTLRAIVLTIDLFVLFNSFLRLYVSEKRFQILKLEYKEKWGNYNE